MKKLSPWDEIRYGNDWRSIILGICLILGIFIFCFVMLNRGYLGMKLAELDKSEETTGMVINRAEHTRLRQTTNNGNLSEVDGIKFYYTYFVNGVQYYSNQTLDHSILIAQQLNKLRVVKLPVNVTVRYNKDHPSQSMLWFE